MADTGMTLMDNSELNELNKKIDTLEKEKAALLERLSHFESDGVTKLYYSLNRKMSEMADLLNQNSLSNIAINDAKDKSFERLKAVWNDASDLAVAVKGMAEIAGIMSSKGDGVKKAFTNVLGQDRS